MQLEVGMNIYKIDGFNFSASRLTITRVTPKFAFVRVHENHEMKFKRDVGDGVHFRVVGADIWTRTSYSAETPELRSKYYHNQLVQDIKGVDFASLSTEQLEVILDIVK